MNNTLQVVDSILAGVAVFMVLAIPKWMMKYVPTEDWWLVPIWCGLLIFCGCTFQMVLERIIDSHREK